MKNVNKNIFCNTPWYEIHIYQDGRLGICCQEAHHLYDKAEDQYNIRTMSISDWVNSDPVKQFRYSMTQNKKHTACQRCYYEEMHQGHSRRLNSLQKSAIFVRQAFYDSLEQSPGYPVFAHSDSNQGHTITSPIDLHVDLGNYCNLACKMCNQGASSTIAMQNYKWGDQDAKRFIGTDWTKDLQAWNRFKNELLEMPGLHNVHFMGGETLISNRFEDFIDTMIANQRFNLCFSFVSNGTTFNESLMKKLLQFERVGIEISIETVDDHNAYQRQGTDTKLVLDNIKKYMDFCNGTSITVAVRPAMSLLTIGYYTTLLQYATDNNFIVKSNVVINPRFLSAEILPNDVKQHYAEKYKVFLEQFADIDSNKDYNVSDPTNHRAVIKEQALQCLSVLQTSTPRDSELQLAQMVAHCKKWDSVYNYNARQLYPEFKEIFDRYGY